MLKIALLLTTVTLVAVAGNVSVVLGQTLSKEDPDLLVTGQTMNTTIDDLDIDLTIHADSNMTEPQETISMEGATDIDINGLVPPGRTVILTNTTAIVTTFPVEVAGGDVGAAEAADPSTIQETGGQ